MKFKEEEQEKKKSIEEAEDTSLKDKRVKYCLHVIDTNVLLCFSSGRVKGFIHNCLHHLCIKISS
tara:strand:+ start:9528 stop:9722 length:195 start_codon:yes stop_codon:yes gene_type:complete